MTNKNKTFLLILGILIISYFLIDLIPTIRDTVSMKLNTNNLINSSQESPERIFLQTWRIIKNNYYEPTMNSQDWKRWKSRYASKIKTQDDAYVAINTMIASLDDPYSRYMDKEEYKEQSSNINSKITGIGVNITSVAGKTVIISVIEKSPAETAKIQAGDIILKIEDKEANGMSLNEVARLIRGEVGTRVNITILRDNKKIKKSLIRKEIKIKDVKSEILKDNIGYITINSFIGNDMFQEFKEAMGKTKNTDALIIDLRSNAGGLLPNAISISDEFLDTGKIVSIVDRSNMKTNMYAHKSNEKFDKPIFILVNKGTASASEIFSGAMKDNKKAILIGETTYGKGMIQKIFPLPQETGLNVTIAKYLTPNGTDINKQGIEPDINIKYTKENFLKNNDAQLEKAVELAKEKIKNK